MQIDLKIQATKEILRTVSLPAQPAVVTELVKLTNNPNVGTDRVGKELKKDPLLVAKVLKIVNSPAFGLRRRVTSVEQAIGFMGISMFQKAVLASAMRDVFSLGHDQRDALIFWNHSEIVAAGCELIAKKRAPELVMQAYLSGLFHDCAVPLLCSKFENYQPLVELAMDYESDVLEAEEMECSTNHCLVGYFFAKSWNLPDSVCLTILHHHDEQYEDLEDETTQTLASILRVSEYLIQNYDVSTNIKTVDTAVWAQQNRSTLDTLLIDASDLTDFEEELLEILNSNL